MLISKPLKKFHKNSHIKNYKLSKSLYPNVHVRTFTYLIVLLVGFGRATRPCAARTRFFRIINTDPANAAPLLLFHLPKN